VNSSTQSVGEQPKTPTMQELSAWCLERGSRDGLDRDGSGER